MITEKELDGVPYQILPFQGKLLVSINNSVGKFISQLLIFFIHKSRFDYLNFL